MMHHLLSFLFAILILQTPTKLNAVDLAAEAVDTYVSPTQKFLPSPRITHPKILWIINQLRHYTISKRKPLYSNRLILHGSIAHDKSSLARTIATEAGCEFMSLNGPSIVGPYLGEGAEKIRKLFTDAEKRFNETGKPVILFIDEIDAICPAIIDSLSVEHQVATQELWCQLNKYRDHVGIFFICATSQLTKLDCDGFVDRLFHHNRL